MAENYLTLVKSFVRKNGLHNIISIHTMAINEHRINFFVETKEEPKVEEAAAPAPVAEEPAKKLTPAERRAAAQAATQEAASSNAKMTPAQRRAGAKAAQAAAAAK